MVSGVVISDVSNFEEIKKKIVEGEAENFHVLADFDRTFTYGLDSEGKKTTTVISQLRSDPEYLGKEYFDEAHRLFYIYHPIEISSKISLKEKMGKMHEWWAKHFKLLVERGLNKELIQRIVKERPMKFRAGVLDFISFLDEKNIPLVIMSAGPGDMIVEYLKANGLMTEDVYVIANRYEFDEFGDATKIKEPIIHSFNKSEITLKGFGIHEKIKERKNVLLLGDMVGDSSMIDGFEYNNLLKVGFLNENVDQDLEKFKENFDVVITDDGDFNFVNDLLGDIQ